MRECGLKYENPEAMKELGHDTPSAGVWIKMLIFINVKMSIDQNVTPGAGVWIEIILIRQQKWKKRSLPVRECGLK